VILQSSPISHSAALRQRLPGQIDKFTSRCHSTIALLIASLFRIITQYGCRAMIALTSARR
jgi:hypothetical protein